MTAIEHLPERLVVVSWDSPRAVPAVVRAADKMPPRDGEVEYVRADLHLGAVDAETLERYRWALDEAVRFMTDRRGNPGAIKALLVLAEWGQ